MAAPMSHSRIVPRSIYQIFASRSCRGIYRTVRPLQIHSKNIFTSKPPDNRMSKYVFRGVLGLTVAGCATGVYMTNALSSVKVHAEDGGKPPQLTPSKMVGKYTWSA